MVKILTNCQWANTDALVLQYAPSNGVGDYVTT